MTSPTTATTPHVLDNLVALNPDGRQVRLGTLWAGRTAVLMFVRHFGCLFCKQQVAEITPFVERIRDAGAELFVIGHGSVAEARAFRDEQQPAMSVLTDPSRQSYCALDMQRGRGTVLRPSVLARGIAAFKAGFRQSRVAGNPFQQGGVVIIEADGVERYRYISRFAGDHPDPAAILRHCPSPLNHSGGSNVETHGD